MTSKIPVKLQDKAYELFFNTYSRLNIIIEEGEGVYLKTSNGYKLLDMFGGLAVNLLGYNNPDLNSAIDEQIRKYIHLSNLFLQPKQIELAEKLLDVSGFKKVFFCNSGTEANESAIKLTRKYFGGTNKKKIFSLTGSFHGRTMGALTLTARQKYREMYKPLLPNIYHLRFNSADELTANIDENTAAVFVEYIQGESGINIVSNKFIEKLYELRNKHEFLIIADEIQSGLGRTGKYFSFEHYNGIPDIILLAKGLGGGLPLGAMLGNERVMNVFQTGEHGSTFGGNPVAASCGCVIMDKLKDGLLSNVNVTGNYLINELSKIKSEYRKIIMDIRGFGFMIGIELSVNCKSIVDQFLQHGVLVNCTNSNVIRLLPPLILNNKDVSFFLNAFREVLKQFNSSEV